MVKLTPVASSLKALTITLQSPQETLQGSPTTLPTSEPSAGNEQISYTVQAADLPTFNIQPYSKVWIATVVGAGKFVTAGTLSWRMKKNGASVATGTTSVSANYFYTMQCWFYDVQVGDVLAISLWSNKSDSNWDYNAYFILPSRVSMSKNRLYIQVTYGSNIAVSLTLGNPASSAINAYRVYNDDTVFSSPPSTSKVLYNGDINNYALFRTSSGDNTNPNNGSGTTSATSRPYYSTNRIPASVSFRLLDAVTI